MPNSINNYLLPVSSDHAGCRLDHFLKEYYPHLSHGRLQKALRKGEIRVNGLKSLGNARLNEADNLRLPPIKGDGKAPSKAHITKINPKIAQRLAQNLQSNIIYDDAMVMLLNKPSGLAVQGGSTLKEYLDMALPDLIQQSAFYEKGQIGRLVHRLDRDTSGLIIIAKTSKAAQILTQAFREHTLQKTYLALVIGVPELEEGTIILRMNKKKSASGHEKMEIDEENGQYAKTDYELLESLGKRISLLKLYPQTGRTHQLRVHLNAIGHPIYGDGKYGGREAFLTAEEQPDSTKAKLHLHAFSLCFSDDIELPIAGQSFVAPLPAYFTNALNFFGMEVPKYKAS